MTPLPPPPPTYRRQGTLRLALVLLPAIGVAGLAWAGHGAAAAGLFVAVFLIIALGTTFPRVTLFGPLVAELPPAQAQAGKVCVTIDDGPDPEVTPRLLEILDQRGAKALFFVIGEKARAHPELVREIVRRGHGIGNHSLTHPAAHFWRLRPERLWREIAGCQQVLTDILGAPPVWFRPPVGHHNLFVSPPLRALGLRMLVWNCRGFDGVHRDVPGILRRISRSLRPGAIVLLHDATPIATQVLEGTLDLIEKRGLRAVGGVED